MSESTPDEPSAPIKPTREAVSDETSRKLAAALRIIASQLDDGLNMNLRNRLGPATPIMSPGASRLAPKQTLGRLAHTLLHEFVIRERFVCSGMFADPAWSILLDLYVHEQKGRRVSVSSACTAAHVPPTTALRWLRLLNSGGMIERLNDPQDRRRVYVRLTQQSREGLEAYLNQVLQIRSTIEVIQEHPPQVFR
jgi:DNA-binding MarR family transcriptional regulator